ncbi:MAG TPA: hypothetical protein VFT87_05035 [Candidatus Saccharimonadales bacterium]|nr:hypothetical protein [Candidatus Saccharimonadales bacterium]
MTVKQAGPLAAIMQQRTFPNEAYEAYAAAFSHAARASKDSGCLDVRMVVSCGFPGFAHTLEYRIAGMNLDGLEHPMRAYSKEYVQQRDSLTADALQALRLGTVRIEVLFWGHLLSDPFAGMRSQIEHLLALQQQHQGLTFRMIPRAHMRRAYGLTVDRAEFRAPAHWSLPPIQIITLQELDQVTMLPAMKLYKEEPLVDQYPAWRDAFSLDPAQTVDALRRHLA